MNDSIFKPNYTITPTIESNLESIERNRYLVDNMLLTAKHEVWLRRVVNVSRASSTTRIEGANLDEEAVQALASHRGAGPNSPDEQDNLNALEAYDFVDFLSDQSDIPIDELVIRQLNRYFIATAAAPLTPGIYRKGPNTVGDFQPPDQGDVPSLMRSFALWLRSDNDGLHPVLKAGIAHIHLAAIHPFWDGNGRTARGLETLILQRSSYGFKKLPSLEAGLLGIKDEYFAAIRNTLGVEFSGDYDATPWLEFISMTTKFASNIVVDDATDLHRFVESVYSEAPGAGLTTRQIDGYLYATQTGRITRGDYLDITGVSAATASRDLAEMVAKGLFTMEGKTRSRIYRPVPLEDRKEPPVPANQLPLMPGGP